MKHFKLYIFVFIVFLFSNLKAQDQTFWWNDQIFYEIFVRSFYDSDGNGKGDFKGLIEKLDYLNDGNPETKTDLGVTAIWLMPINPSPSYHGYDVTDYRNIEPDYGTMNDFNEFMKQAHARGIKVIIDLVLNHTSNQHPWFTQSTNSSSNYRDWYIWKSTNPGYTGSWGQQVWHFRNNAYYFGMFWSGMPDLNYTNPEVKNEMFDVTKFWLDSVKVDGFRLDAIKHLFEQGTLMENVPATHEFFKEYRTFYKSVNPDAITVGEVWSSTKEVAKYVDGTKVDICFEFDLSGAIFNGVNGLNPAQIKSKMNEILTAYPYLQYATFLSNHDQNRIFSQFGINQKKMRLASSLLLTLPGVPFIYYGEEIGMLGAKPDEDIRKPMQWNTEKNAGFTTGTPWHNLNYNYSTYNVKTMQSDSISLWNHYRNLIKVRSENEAMRKGNYIAVNSDPKIFSFARSFENEFIIAVHNFSVDSLPVYLNLASSNLIEGEYEVTEILTGKSSGKISINENGGFTDYDPGIKLNALTSIMLKIENAVTNIENSPASPKEFILNQNYPNPFNPNTAISYQLSAQSKVELKIFDVLGREVQTLVNEIQSAGNYKVNFDARDLPSGIYIYQIKAGNFVQSNKMILVK